MTDELVIEAEALHKGFGTVQALAGVDLTVPAGTVLGLLGPNGARIGGIGGSSHLTR